MRKLLFLLMFIVVLSTSLTYSQSAESYSWNSVAIGGGGFVTGIFCSPIEQNVIYNRTDVGGAYRWNEANKSWVSMMDWVNADERGLLGVESLAIDPSEPGKVYMMGGTVYWNAANDGIGRSAFLRSDDYGSTWEAIPVWDDNTKYFNVNGNGMGRGNGERLAVDPSNSNKMFYGSRNKGLWTTSNNGSTWSKVESFPVDTTWNGCGISFVVFDPSNSSRIYAGVYRKADNIFVSEDGGSTWSLVAGMPQPTYDGTNTMGLMPQRIAVKPDGSAFYLTLGNGAGPHTMQWDEGWGKINDWYNRGALYKYNLGTSTWTDISPQNFIDPENDGTPSDPAQYYGTYSGISLDPNNPDHMVASSCASYRGPQFWNVEGTWYDSWGDNIFVSEDGGENWVPSFQYYWMDGGYYPPAEQMDKNGTEWIERGSIHWISNAVIDPYNPQRVFVNSGNGVWYTEDIFNYEWSYVDEWGNADTNYIQYTVWKFGSQGIEEIVPEDVVSIPDGPMVSVMLDAGGLVHTDLTESPSTGLHKVNVAGSDFHLGSTTGLAYASQSGRLASCAKVRSVSTQYNTIPIGPVQWSDDNGISWTTESYTSNPPTDLIGGKVALSADGAVTLWMPSTGNTMYRSEDGAWTTVSGISFNGRPVSDWVNENMFYAYDKNNGYMYVSTDKGNSFAQAGYAGTSNFKHAREVPYNEGHVWVPIANSDGTGALMRSTDAGESFSALSGVDYCEAVGFGKAADGASYPTVFAFAKISGTLGVWRSTDQGASWILINDEDHEYGGLANGEFVVGDLNVFGRVYMSTAGRGIAYGEPAGATVSVTGVSVSPLSDEVSLGGTTQLTATVTPSNATNKSVSWTSNNTLIATVNATGVVTGIGAGDATITVKTADGAYTATSTISVIDTEIPVTGVILSGCPLIELSENDVFSLSANVLPTNASDRTVVWSSNNTSVAVVDNEGNVTVAGIGNATITVTTNDGDYTQTCSVFVTNTEVLVTGVTVDISSTTLLVGETQQVTATVLPANATNQNVSWSTSNSTVASVSSTGLITALADGDAIITVATEDNSYTATCSVTVGAVNIPVEGVSLSASDLSFSFEGQEKTLIETVLPANASNQNVEWFSDDESIVTVSNAGVVTAVAEGVSMVRVVTEEGSFVAECSVEVAFGVEECITISLPYTQNGVGNYCYFTTDDIAYVNSWNMSEVSINGTDFTNTWSSNMPAKIDGAYYINYVGEFDWAHLEIAALKNGKAIEFSDKTNVIIYPNPFTESVNISIDKSENVKSILVIDNLGRTIEMYESEISPMMNIGETLSSGIYLIKVNTLSEVKTYFIRKK